MKFQFLLLVFLICFQACSSQKIKTEDFPKASDINYENTEYSFKVSVPKNWKLYKEVQNDTIKKSAFINWGTPKIYSKSDKTEIENSISIRAFRRGDIKSAEEIILDEYLIIDPASTSLELENGIGKDARIIYQTDSNGLKYKGKSYFKFNNGISYIITFMATPETFETNLELFEKFYSTLIIE